MITFWHKFLGKCSFEPFLKNGRGKIRVFFRDEKKQDDMYHEFQMRMLEVDNIIKFYIGDVRNLQSCKNAIRGTDNVLTAAIEARVEAVIFFDR